MSERDSRQMQAGELNTRCRHYSSQLWQLPFAYTTLVAVSLGVTSSSAFSSIHGYVMIGILVFGLLVLTLVWAISSAEKGAIELLRNLETELGLQVSVQFRPWRYVQWLKIYMITLVLAVGISSVTDLFFTQQHRFTIGDFIMPSDSQMPQDIVQVVAVDDNQYKVFTHYLVDGKLVRAQDYQHHAIAQLDNGYVSVLEPIIDGHFSPDKYISGKDRYRQPTSDGHKVDSTP